MVSLAIHYCFAVIITWLGISWRQDTYVIKTDGIVESPHLWNEHFLRSEELTLLLSFLVSQCPCHTIPSSTYLSPSLLVRLSHLSSVHLSTYLFFNFSFFCSASIDQDTTAIGFMDLLPLFCCPFFIVR